MKDNVICEGALEEAMLKCMKGVSYKASVAYFYLNSVEMIPQLSHQLCDGTYRARPPKHFTIYFPKERNLVSTAFRDRVFQRSLNDNVVYPQMTKSFIYDNMACQKGKGTDLARARMKHFMQDYWHKYGTDGWVLKSDIRKYYESIPHEVARQVFAQKLSGWDLEQVEHILDSQYPTERGFNPGSQMIQILGIALPDKIDHYIKEHLHIKYYLRYQDDSIFIHQDKAYLEYVADEESRLLAEYGLEINSKKTKIVRLTDGFEFLGFRYRLSKSGKVIMSVTSAKVKRDRRHLRSMVAKCKRGGLSRSKADESFECLMAYYAKGDSNRLIHRMRNFYSGLWRSNESNPRREAC